MKIIILLPQCCLPASNLSTISLNKRPIKLILPFEEVPGKCVVFEGIVTHMTIAK